VAGSPPQQTGPQSFPQALRALPHLRGV